GDCDLVIFNSHFLTSKTNINLITFIKNGILKIRIEQDDMNPFFLIQTKMRINSVNCRGVISYKAGEYKSVGHMKTKAVRQVSGSHKYFGIIKPGNMANIFYSFQQSIYSVVV